MKKLKDIRGETIIESLAGILILSLVFVFLCSAIVSAARSNSEIKNADRDFSFSDEKAQTQSGIMQVCDITTGKASQYEIVKHETDPDKVKTGKENYAKTIYRWFTAPAQSQEGSN